MACSKEFNCGKWEPVTGAPAVCLMHAALLPNTQRVANRVVVLPTGITMNDEMINDVAAVIRVLIEDPP